jgi:hypothetical protein
MSIDLTGSLGNISKPLATELVQRHLVTVISSNANKKKEIEDLDAKSALAVTVGTLLTNKHKQTKMNF